MNLIAGLIEIAIGLYCSVQQMISTHDSIFSMMQGSTLITSHISAAQLLLVLQQNNGKDNQIAWVVSWVTQIIFWTMIMPKSPVASMGAHRAIVIIFVCLEVITDAWYAIASPATIDGVFQFVFSANWGGIIGTIAYCLAMIAASTFIFVDGLHRMDDAWRTLNRKKEGVVR
jgi:hypothetical protein